MAGGLIALESALRGLLEELMRLAHARGRLEELRQGSEQPRKQLEFEVRDNP